MRRAKQRVRDFLEFLFDFFFQAAIEVFVKVLRVVFEFIFP